MAVANPEKLRLNFYRCSDFVKSCPRKCLTAILDKELKKSRPPNWEQDDTWTIDDFLYEQSKIVYKKLDEAPQTKKKKSILYPGRKKNTDLEEWDISLFVWVLKYLFNVNATVCKELESILDMRNTLAHNTNEQLDDIEFQSYVSRLSGSIDRMGTELHRPDFLSHAEGYMEAVNKGYTLDSELIDKLKKWHDEYLREHGTVAEVRCDLQSVKKLVEVQCTETTQIKDDNRQMLTMMMEMTHQMNEMHSTYKREGKWKHLNIPGSRFKLRIENINEEAIQELSEYLVNALKSANEKRYDESTNQEERAILEKALNALLVDGSRLDEVTNECVAFYMQCDTVETLLRLVIDCLSGRMTDIFKPLESYLRKQLDCPSLELRMVIDNCDFMRCIQPVYLQIKDIYDMDQMGMPSDTNGNNYLPSILSVSSPDQVIRQKSVEIDIMVTPASLSHREALVESVRNGSRQHVFDGLVGMLKEKFNAPHLKLTMDVDNSANSYEGQHGNSTMAFVEILSITGEIETAQHIHVVNETGVPESALNIDTDCEIEHMEKIDFDISKGTIATQPDVPVNETLTEQQKVKHLEKKAHEELDNGRITEARKLAVMIADVALKQKLKSLDVLEPDDESGTISKWYMKAGEILLQTKEYRLSTRYFFSGVAHEHPEYFENIEDLIAWISKEFTLDQEISTTLKEYWTKQIVEVINDLIGQCQYWLNLLDHITTRNYLYLVQFFTDLEFDKFIEGEETHTSDEQMATWLMTCTVLFISIGAFFDAGISFYRAGVLDPQWDIQTHSTLSAKIWGGISPWTSLLQFDRAIELLDAMDQCADFAVERAKWQFAFKISNEIFQLAMIGYDIDHYYLRNTESRVMCLLFKQEKYDDLKRLCKSGLENNWNYERAEAFEYWARALMATGNVRGAVKKCEEGLKCAKKTEEEMQRLSSLREALDELLDNINLDVTDSNCDPDWLKGLIGNTKQAVDSEREKQKIKIRHRRPKRRETVQQPEHVPKSKQARTALEICRELTTPLRERCTSESSTITYDFIASDSESATGNESDSGFATMSQEEPVIDDMLNVDEPEDISIYKQSLQYHKHKPRLQSEQIPEVKMIEHGLEFKNEFIAGALGNNKNRRPFYDQLLSEAEMTERLSRNPNKFVLCNIKIESSHVATCTPLVRNGRFSQVEVCGRSKIGRTFNNDQVVVELLDTDESKDKRFGRVIGVYKSFRVKHPVFICCLDETESHLMKPMCKSVPKISILNKTLKKLYPNKKKRQYKVEVYDYDVNSQTVVHPTVRELNPPQNKDFVFMVAYIGWSESDIYPKGVTIGMKPVGNSPQKGLNILKLQYSVPGLYSKDAIGHAEEIDKGTAQEQITEATQKRKDISDEEVFTYGYPDTTEIDKALSIQPIDGGFKIGVHITDVAAYLQRDSPIDKEAKSRLVSFISEIGEPVPMLPSPFTNKLCNLILGEKRMAFTVYFYLTKDGKPIQNEASVQPLFESVICVKQNFNLDEIVTDEVDGKSTSPITRLIRIAKEIRRHRIESDECFVENDFKLEMTDGRKSNEALLNEYMYLAEKKVGKFLHQKFKGKVPYRHRPPPSKESLEMFLKNNNSVVDVVVALQGRRILGRIPNLAAEPISKSDKSIIVPKSTWSRLKKLPPGKALQTVMTDNEFPLQHLALQNIRLVQKREMYSLSATSTYQAPFTSPMSAYIDIVVQRLLKKALEPTVDCPYEISELRDICLLSGDAAYRASEYHEKSNLLHRGLQLLKKPLMTCCFVGDVSERSIALSSPELFRVPRKYRSISFSDLNVALKPNASEVHDLVTATWRRRIYMQNVHHIHQEESPTGTVEINERQMSVYLPIKSWARVTSAAVDNRLEDFKRRLSKLEPLKNKKKCNDVQTDCKTIECLQTYTEFSMTFSRGQVLQIQLSASLHNGIVIPVPTLYKMTKSVLFCLDHSKNPVSTLYRFSKAQAVGEYISVQEYKDVWIPIVLMESAVGAVSHEETCSVNGVPIQFMRNQLGDVEGKFDLSLAHCETRNIELSGTQYDEGDELNAYDWLCISSPLKRTEDEHGNITDIYWVGHAEVTEVIVKSKKSDSIFSGKITVKCKLHGRVNIDPCSFDKPQTYRVEILRKTEVDRRTECFLRKISDGTLASHIALKKSIPLLDSVPTLNALDVEHVSVDADETGQTKGHCNVRRQPLPQNNSKQQEAVEKALKSRLSLIQGPPGTGKTFIGIKLIYLFDKLNSLSSPKKQVVFCGPSNKAVDLVARMMRTQMGRSQPDFIRVYGRSIEEKDYPVPGRSFLSPKTTRGSKAANDLRDVSLHHLIRKEGRPNAEKIRRFDEMFRKQTNPMQNVEELKQYVHLIREASIEEIRKHDVVLCTTAIGANPKVLEATCVAQVIIDEAGMCSEPQCLVPIIATNPEQVVLIGDHKQLRPIVMCKEAAALGLDTSLFERYASAKKTGVPFTMLEQQYRMNPHLCEFPSRQFYDGQLKTEPGLWVNRTLRIWPQGPYGVYPHVFVHMEGEEEALTVADEDGNEQSKSNEKEADYVVRLFDFMKREAKGDTVHILSQYNSQRALIGKKLKAKKLDPECVSTVVSSQGGEWDYVIFSTVRSLPKYKIEESPTLGWCIHNLGFITDRNQVNVALTRARKGLVIVGNKHLLKCDKLLGTLIRDYESKGCVKLEKDFQPWIRTGH